MKGWDEDEGMKRYEDEVEMEGEDEDMKMRWDGRRR